VRQTLLIQICDFLKSQIKSRQIQIRSYVLSQINTRDAVMI